MRNGFSYSRWSCECKYYCTSTNIYSTSSQIHIYMLSSFTLLPWCNLFQTSSKRSWIKYSEWYQSTIWLVKQPGILAYTCWLFGQRRTGPRLSLVFLSLFCHWWSLGFCHCRLWLASWGHLFLILIGLHWHH